MQCRVLPPLHALHMHFIPRRGGLSPSRGAWRVSACHDQTVLCNQRDFRSGSQASSPRTSLGTTLQLRGLLRWRRRGHL